MLPPGSGCSASGRPPPPGRRAMARRVTVANSVNPASCCGMAEQAIRKAQAGDFAEVRRVAERATVRRPGRGDGRDVRRAAARLEPRSHPHGSSTGRRSLVHPTPAARRTHARAAPIARSAHDGGARIPPPGVGRPPETAAGTEFVSVSPLARLRNDSE